MLYVVEVPKKGLPKCWSVPDMESFVTKVQLERKTICHQTDRVMYERITAKELLGRLGSPAPSALIGTELEWLYDVVMDQGMHAKLYRADAYTKDDGSYTTEQIDEYEASLSWLSESLDAIRVFESVEEARAALYDMRNWLFSGGMEGLTGLAGLLDATPRSGTSLGKAVLQQFQLCAANT